jgi:hypothetical protein
MWHTWERRENWARVWWESPNEREGSEDRHRWEDGIRVDLRETG